MRISSYLYLVLLGLVLSGCSVTMPKMNEPLKVQTNEVRAKNLQKVSHRSEELTIILTFSGGGTRAAALSYGVMDELRKTQVTINHKKRSLVDEVDLISSVSGGSFTSAYYGLFGNGLFYDFKKNVLKRPIQSDLIKLSFLSPKSWIRLLPGLFERSDLAAEYYNQLIFNRKNFGDFRKDAPFIIINATDLSLGQGFSFTDYHFSWICSDLNSYPVSRAVAASSAVPVLFSPITLKNHSSRCHFKPILWSPKSDKGLKNYQQTLNIQKYRDDKTFKYLHLVDGGISDNLGIRSLLDIVTLHRDNMWHLLNTYKMKKTKRMVFIVVNASGFKDPNVQKNRVSPSVLSVLESTSDIRFKNYNIDTLDLLRSKFPEWQKQIREGRCNNRKAAGCDNIKFDLIEVNLQDVTAEEKKELGFIPTSLELPAKTVDQLTDVGGKLLRRSEVFQQLVNSLR